MKKTIEITLMAICLCASLSAACDGRSTVGLAYTWDGDNRIALTSDHTGYFTNENSQVWGDWGYYVGLDAGFAFTDVSNWDISMIVGPAYRYHLPDVPMDIEAALGISADADSADVLSFGIGGYIGAAYIGALAISRFLAREGPGETIPLAALALLSAPLGWMMSDLEGVMRVGEIYTIVCAAYSFFSLGLTIADAAKRRQGCLLRLAQAALSMLTLETLMLAEFSSDTACTELMVKLTGVGLAVLCACLAVVSARARKRPENPEKAA